MTLRVVDSDGQPGGGQRRWARPLLIGSLMLNLLLIGAIAGGFWAARHRGPHGLQRIEQGFIGYVKSLPKDRAQALLASSESSRQTFRAQRRELRERRAAALAVLEADALDKEKLRQALAGVGEAETTLERTGEGVFLDMIERLTPAERKAYVAWRQRHDGPDHHRRDRPDAKSEKP